MKKCYSVHQCLPSSYYYSPHPNSDYYNYCLNYPHQKMNIDPNCLLLPDQTTDNPATKRTSILTTILTDQIILLIILKDPID
ncbi:hypothetical protein M8J76_008036 [Diaphorina citri]|nr:hypothetical protein M8J76_008036 [Diaphorina citri]